MNNKVFFLLILTFSFLAALAQPEAVEAESFSITPSIITLHTQAPANLTRTFRLENKDNDPLDLSIQLLPFTQDDQKNGRPSYRVDSDRFFTQDPDIFQKIQFFDGDNQIQEVNLLPHEAKDIQMKISIPSEEKNSDYYFSILFISKNSSGVDDQQSTNTVRATSQLNPGIVSNVLLSIFTGKKEPEGIIDNYKAPLAINQGPVPFTISFRNTGDYLLQPSGTILIQNMFGQVVGKISIPATNVLANTTRDIQATWDERFLVGPYTATLYLTEDTGATFTRPLTFFAFPVQLLSSIIIGIIMAITAWKRIRKFNP